MKLAKAYRAKRDVSVPLVIGRVGEDDYEETSGETFAAGSLIPVDRMTKFHREQAEAGNLDHLLEPVEDEEAEGAFDRPPGEPEFGVFVPEHEAERTALRVYGHVTVPREQELEALSAGEVYHEEHMGRVRESGADQRPVQEHMAAEEPRVPNSVLTGAETRTGLPHNQGPADAEHEYGGEEMDSGNSDVPATRPRPSLASRSEAEESGQQPSGIEGSDNPGEHGE